jgi:xanthosine utilization system XapX-like protein
MAKRTSSGLLLPILVVVGLVAVFGVNKVVDFVEGIFSGNPVIVGAGETAIMEDYAEPHLIEKKNNARAASNVSR